MGVQCQIIMRRRLHGALRVFPACQCGRTEMMSLLVYTCCQGAQRKAADRPIRTQAPRQTGGSLPRVTFHLFYIFFGLLHLIHYKHHLHVLADLQCATRGSESGTVVSAGHLFETASFQHVLHFSPCSLHSSSARVFQGKHMCNTANVKREMKSWADCSLTVTDCSHAICSSI